MSSCCASAHVNFILHTHELGVHRQLDSSKGDKSARDSAHGPVAQNGARGKMLPRVAAPRRFFSIIPLASAQLLSAVCPAQPAAASPAPRVVELHRGPELRAALNLRDDRGQLERLPGLRRGHLERERRGDRRRPARVRGRQRPGRALQS